MISAAMDTNGFRTSLTSSTRLKFRSSGAACDVLRRSYRQKEVSPDSIEIEMYGSELLIENRSERMKSYLIRRRERHPDSIENLDAGSRQLPWECVGDWIQFKLELPPGETTLLTLHFKGAEDVAYVRQNF